MICFCHLMKNADCIGIDAEWKPVFSDGKERLSLLQLAMYNRIFVLDVLRLVDHLDANHWSELSEVLLKNNSILKLGFSLRNDWKMLGEVNPIFANIAHSLVNSVDMDFMCNSVSLVF